MIESRSRWPPVLGLALLLLPMAIGAQAMPTSDDCRTCHLTLEDDQLSEPARSYEADVHAGAGFGCLACHGSGGGSELDERSGFLSAPHRGEIPELCARCHSDPVFMRQYNPTLPVDQMLEYRTSGHGRRLLEEGDLEVATCVDCHPAHGILPASDPASSVHAANIIETCGRCHADPDLMRDRGLSVDQVDEYRSSVHGALLLEEGDLSAPVCNDCHGNHGAAPPGVGSVRNVCGQCHSVMADYFEESGHVSVFDAEGLPGCALCHEHHAVEPVSDQLLMDRSTQVCAECHEAADTLGGEFVRMAALLDSLDRMTARSRRTLEDAENRGMEVSEALFDLDEVSNVRTRARSAVHTFHAGPVEAAVSSGLEVTDRARDRGLEAMADHRSRRVGLGTASAIIVLLIAGLLLKIRDSERPEQSTVESSREVINQNTGEGA